MRGRFNRMIVAGLFTVATHSVTAADQNAPSELTIEASIPIAAAHIAFGYGSLWIMSEGDLVRIDPSDNSARTINVPGSENASSLMELDKYRGIAVGEGAVWVPDMANSTIHKIDPKRNEVVLAVTTDIFGNSKGSIGVGAGSIWVITFDRRDKAVTRYKAGDGSIETRIDLPNAGSGVLSAYGSVWVTASNRNELYRIDSRTNEIIATIPIHGASPVLTASEVSVWIPFDTDGVVQRIDGQTGQVVATIETGAADMERDGDITSGGGFIWTINRRSIIAKIDPKTNEVIGRFRPPVGTSTGRRIRHGNGSLWLLGDAIYRMSPP